MTYEPFKKTRLNSGALKGYAVPVPLVVRTRHVRFDISSHFKLNKFKKKQQLQNINNICLMVVNIQSKCENNKFIYIYKGVLTLNVTRKHGEILYRYIMNLHRMYFVYLYLLVLFICLRKTLGSNKNILGLLQVQKFIQFIDHWNFCMIYKLNWHCLFISVEGVMVFNATFNNISVILWQVHLNGNKRKKILN